MDMTNRPISFDMTGFLLASALGCPVIEQVSGVYTHTFTPTPRTITDLPEGVDVDFTLTVSPDGLVGSVAHVTGPDAAATLVRDLIVARLKASGMFQEVTE